MVDDTPETAMWQMIDKDCILRFREKLTAVPKLTEKILAVGISQDNRRQTYSGRTLIAVPTAPGPVWLPILNDSGL